ncbi:aldo/keto reductase [Brooklawnia cerclae]|uniref:Aryl-alcohol dehydrogenase-like predicted oxidoreductase n=1 Tax=Brooklawnia cerclae TaxID=349934 RepID=A0ABX0SJI8_9ACTN|nr:aldo/keto reductase [Brooklawnia cerclae]NIH58592.1 aryl-alcohol dehydrogenase-like predicted oxidoreductase [Brooklawnia cerclae]
MTRIPRTELDVFPLNLGGNTFGWTSDRDTSFEVLDTFVAQGGNFVDTADSYSAWVPGNKGGESETIIGEWLARRGNRDGVVIATKAGAHPQLKGQARATVTTALDASLTRLQTDHVDVYYAHYDDESQTVEDMATTYDGFVKAGKIRAIGLSNFTPERMRAWFEFASSEGLAVPSAIQPHYNLVHRGPYEQTYRPIAERFDAAVFPYYSLASGFLTGKYRTQEDLAGKQRGQGAGQYLNADGLRVIDALVAIADAHGAQPTSVSLAWLLAKGVTAPIASASRADQVPALTAAAALQLTADEVARLDEASATFA